jgi:hypothetical protein
MSALQILLLLVAVAAIIVFASVRARARRHPNNPEVMKALRLRMLRELPEGVASAAPDQPIVVIMDIAYPEATASVFAASTGDASIYFSNGGGVIGGIGHENVRTAAIACVKEAGRHRDRMVATTEFPYPTSGNVCFYVRTGETVYVAEAPEEELGEKRNPLWPLFYAGQNVITQLRTAAPNLG